MSYFPPPPPPVSTGWFLPMMAQAWWSFLWTMYAALLAGVLSPLLTRQFWIAEILCHFQAQFVIGLALLAVPFAVFRRWKGMGIVLATLVIAVTVWIAPLYIGRPHAGPRKLRILSANVDCLNQSQTRFLELIAAEQPDVILIFELTRIWAPTIHLDEKGYPYSAFSPSPGHSGCGIFSRHPLEGAEVQTLEPYPFFVPRARLTHAGKTLRIFGTHPMAPYNQTELDLRNRQMITMAGIVGSDSTATIVAGDFNSSSWSSCFTDFERATGLHDTRPGFGLLTTFPAEFWPFRTTIDHCLISPDIFVVDRRVGPNIGSDHLPIVIDLTWDD